MYIEYNKEVFNIESHPYFELSLIFNALHLEWVASESNVSAFTSWQYFNTLSSIRISSGDAELIDNLNIYPNPTRGLFNISFVSDDIVTLELLVLNASGKVIMIENKEMFVGEYTKQVDLSEYPKGIYMVQIRTNNSFITKRIVVQ